MFYEVPTWLMTVRCFCTAPSCVIQPDGGDFGRWGAKILRAVRLSYLQGLPGAFLLAQLPPIYYLYLVPPLSKRLYDCMVGGGVPKHEYTKSVCGAVQWVVHYSLFAVVTCHDILLWLSRT